MIVRKKNNMHTSKRKKVLGGGFIDTLKGIGEYIHQNKDLLAEPIENVAALAATEAATEAGKTIINRIKDNRNKKVPSELLKESQEILKKLKTGSGIKKF